ncbi:MAG: TraV family lipoprotein [Candidatus Tectomicrobia bacterium]|nr:TraV family lipoprotein [Candidatus Tectomicrobia bacterium]
MNPIARVGLIAIGIAFMVSGCVPKPDMGDPVDLHARMGPQAAQLPAPRLQPSPGALGPEAPYLPLLRPPQVQRVWVTAHLNDDGDLIAGHWVYLMLTASQWLLRDYEGTRELRLKLPAPVAPEKTK